MSRRTEAALFALAVALVAIGVGGWSWQAGLIVAGLLVALATYWLGDPKEPAKEPKEAE